MSKYDSITGRRWNELIWVANGFWKRESLGPLNEEEEELLNSMLAEKAELEKEYGHEVIFDNVEYDFDDPGLDIYNESVEDMVEERKRGKE